MRIYPKQKVFFVCLFASLILLLNNCATMFKGTSQDVSFSSDPIEAEVYVNGFLMGETPCVLPLISKNTYNIEIRKEGYETKTYAITNNIGAGWVILDVVCGLIPVIIDASTGAWYNLDQNNINAILEVQNPDK